MLLSAGIASGVMVPPVSELHLIAESGFFGGSVAMDGGFTIVGARSDADNGSNAGAAYVYDTATATELYKLTASDINANDRFGSGVAVSGNYAVIGALGKEDIATGTVSNYGAAYVFDLTTGTQVAKLVPNAELPMATIGGHVAIDGNNVVIAGSGYDTGGVNNSGAVFHYDLNSLIAHGSAPNTFVENQVFISPRVGVDYRFGNMDIDGTTLIVGEKAAAFMNGIPGMAHLFDVSTGTLLGSFMGDDTNLSDSFGHSVAIDGNMAAVGSYSLNSVGVNSGTAYVFDITDPTAVVQDFKLEEAGPAGGVVDNFGLHLDLEDGVVLVNASHDDDGFSNAGSAFLFDATTGTQLQKFFPSDPQSGAMFGWDVAMSGHYLVVGAVGKNQAYIFHDSTPIAPPGDFDLDGDVDDADIDMLCDFIRNGLAYDSLYDVSGPGEDGVPDSVVDTNDLDYHIRALVETAVGNGTEYADFNLDGMVDTTDLTRLATNYGAGDWKWDEGNANRNIDLVIDTTDLAILATYYGFVASPDAIPEPMTLSVLVLGASGLLRIRRNS